MQKIPIIELSLVFIPTVFLLAILFRWGLKGFVGLYANIRMVLQLLLVGFLLTYVFEIAQPIIIILVIIFMIAVSAWIALRSLDDKNIQIGKISNISKERSIDVMITRLRKKIEMNPKSPKFLQTIRGSGYVLWIK